jgi:hypothetical protein
VHRLLLSKLDLIAHVTATRVHRQSISIERILLVSIVSVFGLPAAAVLAFGRSTIDRVGVFLVFPLEIGGQ